jgi:hypothetical protein
VAVDLDIEIGRVGDQRVNRNPQPLVTPTVRVPGRDDLVCSHGPQQELTLTLKTSQELHDRAGRATKSIHIDLIGPQRLPWSAGMATSV